MNKMEVVTEKLNLFCTFLTTFQPLNMVMLPNITIGEKNTNYVEHIAFLL